MVLFNYATRELTAKIVYYGPGLCGKTTNLEYIHKSLPEKSRGKMLSLATQTDRTLFFDFLPIDLGSVKGMKTRVQLYTVPGQVFYDATRKLVLKGADGVVFVCDSQKEMLDSNVESWDNLKANLVENGLDINTIPIALQFNKRDLPNVMPVKELNRKMNEVGAPYFEAVALTGKGVQETLKGIAKLVLENLSQKYTKEGKELRDARDAGPIRAVSGLVEDAEELVEDLPGPPPAIDPIEEFEELEEVHELKSEPPKSAESAAMAPAPPIAPAAPMVPTPTASVAPSAPTASASAPAKPKKPAEKTLEVKISDLPPELLNPPAPTVASKHAETHTEAKARRDVHVSASSPATDLHVPVEVTVGKGEQVVRLHLTIDLKIKIVG